ncbi:hypothetical protein H1D32_13985 [Anaerobacillus sp. CMMVII]|uniref:SRPBCC family protein n=1 Tax=Anaerobacillus sp. CMMVII TaxID=2755588 RepID=UPI0021B7F814|nr:hypothetical protein [Anaerobacillus sp. CMMVII]MCT8138748.1 hypothetical protein [Anaerobacillus sp. CMMVII]
MAKGEFVFKTKLPIDKNIAWNFFNDINNLVRIIAFPKITIILYEGVKKGSKTELDLNFYLFKTKWLLTYVEVDKGHYFIDKSTSLPFPFKSWEHTHSFEEEDGKVTIMTDKVRFESYLPGFITKIGLYLGSFRKHCGFLT